MTRLNYDKLNRKRKARNLTDDGYYRSARKVGSRYITDKQAKFLADLRKICDEKGIKYRKERISLKEQASNEINGLIALLKKHGYDTKGRRINEKKGFLEYMQKKKGEN